MRRLLIALLLCIPSLAAARQGGGGHFGGGYHGGYSGGGGYPSGSYRDWGRDAPGWFIALVLVVGLLILCVGLVATVLANQYALAERNAPGRPPTPRRPPGLDALLSSDPSFDADAFGRHAMKVMERINVAWCAGDLGPTRALVSDGVFVHFRTYLSLLASHAKRNVMADWRALSATIVRAEADDRWDIVHVSLTALARDLEVNVGLTKQQAAHRVAKAPLERYTEIWTFVRRRDRGPDWVLTKITQASELATIRGTDVPGLDAIRARNPEVNVPALEDRASMAFWLWLQARVTGKREPLDRVCRTPGTPDAPRADLLDLGVGSVTAVSASTDGGVDRVNVDVRWSAWERPLVTTRLTLARAGGAAEWALEDISTPD